MERTGDDHGNRTVHRMREYFLFGEIWILAPHAIGDWVALLWLGRYFCDIVSSEDIWSSLGLRHGDRVDGLGVDKVDKQLMQNLVKYRRLATPERDRMASAQKKLCS